MPNYAKSLPRDKGGDYPLQNYPAPLKALAQYFGDNVTASSVITMNVNTTQIEVGASGTNGANGALLRWIPITETAAVTPFASVTAANFDHFIPNNTVRSFVVPRETGGTAGVVTANIQNGLYQRFAVNRAGGAVTSIMSTEY